MAGGERVSFGAEKEGAGGVVWVLDDAMCFAQKIPTKKPVNSLVNRGFLGIAVHLKIYNKFIYL